MRVTHPCPRVFAVVLLCLSLAPDTYGQVSSRLPGAFLEIGIGARQSAMGYAGIASSGGTADPAWNASSLVHSDGIEASFTYVDQLGLLSYQYVSLVIPLQEKKTALAISVTDSGDEALRELTGRLAFAYRLGPLELGVGSVFRRAVFGRNQLNADDYVVFDQTEVLEGIGRQVVGDAGGIGLDVGLSLQAAPALRVGAAIRNVIAPVRWNSKTRDGLDQTRGSYIESIPLTLSLGTSWTPTGNAEFSIDFNPGLDDDIANRYSVGAEYLIASVLALRSGIEIISDGLKNERYTAGFGIRIPDTWGVRVYADYAFVSDDLADTQQISMTVGF
jgi:hypothetical protein